MPQPIKDQQLDVEGNGGSPAKLADDQCHVGRHRRTDVVTASSPVEYGRPVGSSVGRAERGPGLTGPPMEGLDERAGLGLVEVIGPLDPVGRRQITDQTDPVASGRSSARMASLSAPSSGAGLGWGPAPPTNWPKTVMGPKAVESCSTTSPLLLARSESVRP